MNIRRDIRTALLMTIVTTVLFGLAYPLMVTALAQLVFPDKANGQLLVRNGRAIGSRIIGQTFSSPEYFHGRPSAAGAGYDAANSGGSNLGPTNKKLAEAVTASVAAERRGIDDAEKVPVDLVTASGSGLDPDISPAAALFQVTRIARTRHASEADIRALVDALVEGRQFGILGEPRVNVLVLNLALDERYPRGSH